MDKPLPTLAGPHTQFKRHPERGTHERAAVHTIIDEASICHLSFVLDGQAVTLPTAHARIDDRLYVHGAIRNRMLGTLAGAARASATFTLIDGLVLARTAFHHSMNFRSALVFGPIAEVVDREEKRAALHALVEQIAPGRMSELDPPSDAELQATFVLRLTIDEASAKQRQGPPLDGADDLARDVWAGEVPLALRATAPRRDPRLRSEQLISAAANARADEPIVERWHGEQLLSSDRSRLQFDRIHRFLSAESYWAKDVSRARLATALDRSLCFGAYLHGVQV
ncbi:MAG TPA: pyridoxamine 5'-phosphate oxidase family protein, partial [Polyangiales bacterium]